MQRTVIPLHVATRNEKPKPREHRKKVCERCAFFASSHNQCRRRPPLSNGWPHVDKANWCGEWSPLVKGQR